MTAATIAPARQQLPTSRYRADIDGLRAVSVLLVVAFHAGVTPLAGGYVGVDVFFVISGYLVTGILVRTVLDRGRLSLADFYARRVRRLLPLSSLVLVTTLLVGLWASPPLARRPLLADAASAALYVANWRYAGQATAYSDSEVTDSLLLHYWSLSIEEQFYLVWPLLIVLVAVLVRRRQHRFVPVLGVALGVVVTASLTASIVLTRTLGPEAYYLTHTRLWEMGLGGLLAIALPRLRRRPRGAGAALLALGGLAAIAVAATTYGAETAFPGWRAVVPALGAAAVIAAGVDGATRPSRVLGAGPLPYLGRLSYAWYLWHWPAIGLALLLRERSGWDVPAGAAVAGAVVASLALSALSHRLVEDPVRHHPWLRVAPRRNLALAVGLTGLPVLVAVAFLQVGDTGDRAVADAGAQAEAMTPLEAADDRVTVGPADCHVEQPEDDPTLPCVLGDPDGDRTVAIIGDSHARHWVPTLDVVARERGWRLLALTKSACTPIDVRTWNSSFEREYVECDRWRDEVYEHLAAQEDLAAVLISHSRGYRGSTMDDTGRRGLEGGAFTDAWSAGAARTYAALGNAGRIVVLRDTYWAPEEVPACLSANLDDPGACALTREEHGVQDAPIHEAERAAATDRVAFLDPRPIVCPDDPCSMVTADGLIKYRDRHHLTQTFALTLADELGRELDELLGTSPADVAAAPVTEPVASPAAMTPDEAAEDHISLGQPGCHVHPRAAAPELPCVFGAPDGSPTVALVGDSHARHWLPAWDQLARDRGWRLRAFTKSSCPPIDVDTWNGGLERPYDECAAWRAAVVDVLADEEDLALVVLARSRGYRGVVLDEAGDRALPDERVDALWTDGARRTFATLSPLTDHLLIVRDTPWAPTNVPACLAEGPPDRCAIPVGSDAVDDRNADLERSVAPPGTAFLDPVPLVCPARPCDAVTADGIVKYRDSHHLTMTFSRLLAAPLGDAVDALTGGRLVTPSAVRPDGDR